MKHLNQYIQEKLIINKDYSDGKMYHPKSFDELRKIIEDRNDKLGDGTEQDPIDFNDIDVSNLDSFCKKNKGIFDYTFFKYIDISDWNVSNVTNMSYMFYMCKELESVGDISNWDVSNVTDMSGMFFNCQVLKSVGDLSKWDVSKVESMKSMFSHCKTITSVGDLSNWNISNLKYTSYMFHNSGIKNTPSWYKV